jgi:hypothetical protein
MGVLANVRFAHSGHSINAMSNSSSSIGVTSLADWKAHSIYSGERWAIGRIKCVPGDYVIKGAI